jgi:hypothetical protein
LAEGDHINYNALTNSEQATKDLYDARAIAVIINDAMVRHIQSIEEVERVYSGNPAFFKFGYDDAGHLVDRTTDQSKRFGGLVSTGLNNDTELGLPESYVQAEVDEDNVPLTKELADNLEDLFIKGELRSAYINHVFELNGITISKTAVSTETKRRAQEIVQKADKMSVEELK